MFCMLLRKHLQGAKIVSVVSPDMERMAIITCDTVDEMGVPSKKYLAVLHTAAHQSDRQTNLIALRLVNFINAAFCRAGMDFPHGRQQAHSI